MKHVELRQFLLEANRAKLSPAEKDVFLYYQSKASAGKFWDSPDATVSVEIGRSRNSVCEARHALKKRLWIVEKVAFRIGVLKTFPVGNSTENDEPPVGNATERVENATGSVGNATDESETRLRTPVSGNPDNDLQPPKRNKKNKEVKVSDKDVWVQEIFAEWQTVLGHPRTELDGKRKTRIKARIAEGFSLEELKSVPRGVLHSPYHIGVNSSGTRYDGIDTIFRDRAQVEKFRDLAESPPKVESNGTHRTNGYQRRTDPDVIAESADFYDNYSG